MLERRADTAVLGPVSILYSIAVFFLKQRRAYGWSSMLNALLCWD